jgi:hypothetical protein
MSVVANIGDITETKYDQLNSDLQKFPYVKKNPQNWDKLWQLGRIRDKLASRIAFEKIRDKEWKLGTLP